MTSLYIPLSILDQNRVRVFCAEVTAPKGEKGYFIMYSVCVKEYDPENPHIVWNKHRVYEDYAKRYRHDAARRCKKAEMEAVKFMKDNLHAHVAAACQHYGVKFPIVDDATSSFTRQVFDAYKDQMLGLDSETQQIITGFEAALEFCRDFDPEDNVELPNGFNYPFATTYKLAQLVKHFCTRLQNDGKWDELLSSNIDLDRIGNCLYYGIVGHGTGFFDEDVLKNDKPFLEYLDSVMKEMYLDVFLDDGLIVVDASINKEMIKV